MAKGRADASGLSGAAPGQLRRFPKAGAKRFWDVRGPTPRRSAASPHELSEPSGSEPPQQPPQLDIASKADGPAAMPAEAAPGPDHGPPGGGFERGLDLLRDGPAGLSEEEEACLSAVLDHELSPNTVRSYRSQWQTFAAWAQKRAIPALPAEPVQVAAYLAERLDKLGHKPSTLRAAAAAIAFVHNACRFNNPCASPEVKAMLKSATRRSGRSQKQAEALTADALAAIESTAYRPRVGRGGRLEAPQTAQRRADVDIAIVSLMRDAMLRVSEAAELVWADLAAEADGTGRLLIRRSKTDADGEGAVAFVSEPTMKRLEAIRSGQAPSDSVFGLRPNQIALRIKKAAKAAGLGDGFSGHSPRVGMARDLARAGIELPSLMNAGRWATPAMPALYIRNETAGRGAVAQFYGNWRK